MDFATRNLYRTAVEQLARGSGVDELEVANRAVQAAAAATERRRKDPGYYLTAEGRPGFEAALGFRPSFWRSEEHTSELQSLMRISYAVFCLKKKKKQQTDTVTLTL